MSIPRGQTPERRAYMKAWNVANPRDRSGYKSAYDQKNKDRNAAYRALSRDRRKANNAEWYRRNREKILARTKARAAKNRDKISAYQASYYAANSEAVRARVAAYQAANPDKKAHLENRRRARKAENGGSHTLDDLKEKFDLLGNVCFYCGRPGKMTVDHDIPLSRGGTDNIDNILPSCRPCNSRKNARTAAEFITWCRTNHARAGGTVATSEMKT